EYGVSIMFLKNGFLVDVVKEKVGRVLKLDSISTGNQWKGVDVLIFNTNHWWTHTGRSQTWDYFRIGNKLVKEMDHMEAYKIGLTTWGTEEDDASIVGFEVEVVSGWVLEEGEGLLGGVWAGWEFVGVDKSVGLLGVGVWVGWECMEIEGSVGQLGGEASELMEAVLGRV
ncbi:protein trichome birefringence-like 42, partial [Fagus crenata]